MAGVCELLAGIEASGLRRAELQFLRRRVVDVAASSESHVNPGALVEYKNMLMMSQANLGRLCNAAGLRAMMARGGERDLARRIERLSRARRWEAHPDTMLVADAVAAFGNNGRLTINRVGSKCEVQHPKHTECAGGRSNFTALSDSTACTTTGNCNSVTADGDAACCYVEIFVDQGGKGRSLRHVCHSGGWNELSSKGECLKSADIDEDSGNRLRR